MQNENQVIIRFAISVPSHSNIFRVCIHYAYQNVYAGANVTIACGQVSYSAALYNAK